MRLTPDTVRLVSQRRWGIQSPEICAAGDEKVAVVIGDGSLTGGMAYEALNGLAQLKTGCVVVINDNNMSIGKNVGGLSKYLNEIRLGNAYNELKTGVESSLMGSKTGKKIAKVLKRSKDNIKQFFVPGMFFEELESRMSDQLTDMISIR